MHPHVPINMTKIRVSKNRQILISLIPISAFEDFIFWMSRYQYTVRARECTHWSTYWYLDHCDRYIIRDEGPYSERVYNVSALTNLWEILYIWFVFILFTFIDKYAHLARSLRYIKVLPYILWLRLHGIVYVKFIIFFM